MQAKMSEYEENIEYSLDSLPTELLLKIMRFLSTHDLLVLREVSPRFSEICVDASLMRNINFENCYKVVPQTLKLLGRLVKGATIYSYTISNCYWLTSSELGSINPRMPHLRHIDVRGTAISVKMLNQILSSAGSLKSLSYEHRWLMRSLDLSDDAKQTWSKLLELNVVLSVCMHSGIFSYCGILQAFTIDTSQQPLKRPLCMCEGSLGTNLPLPQLKYLSIDMKVSAQHPGICANRFPLGFGRMGNLCMVSFLQSAFLQFEEDWATNPVYPKIRSFEISDMCTNPFLDSPRMLGVRYLRVQKKHWTGKQLSHIRNFHYLESLEISTCQKAFLREGSSEQADLSLIEALVDEKIPLKHLNLSSIHLHHGDADNRLGLLLGQFGSLKSLALSVCCLAESSQLQPPWMSSSHQPQAEHDGKLLNSANNFSKRQRTGVKPCTYDICETCQSGIPSSNQENTYSKGCIYCSSILARIVNGNPSVECFELFGADWNSLLCKQSLYSWAHERHKQKYTPCQPSTSASVSEDTLLCLSSWANLQSLVLAGIPRIVQGHSLVVIARNCRKLRSLSLAHLGLTGQCRFLKGLCEALQYMDQLEDLRVEHPNIDGMYMLFQALQRCPSITRLCIIFKNGTINPEDVFTLFKHCPKLNLLCLICALTATECKILQQGITRNFGKSRPALRVAVSQYPKYADQLSSCLKGIPHFHIRDFIVCDSRVATTPPSWKELQQILDAEENGPR